MHSFQITFLYPTDGTADRSQSVPSQFMADSIEDAKRQADAMIERESLTHRTVDIAVLTRAKDEPMEITRWLRAGGWMDA